MEAEGLFEIEVAYALPDEQVLIRLAVEPGTSVAQAIERSGLTARFPALACADVPVGIHGQGVERDTLLRAGDRVEIYRPLVTTARQARRQRAARRT
jgi:uncharacterized protein